ncbi:MAG: hypothetical protein OHK0017_12110 [Patescibacteria group bacterium]
MIQYLLTNPLFYMSLVQCGIGIILLTALKEKKSNGYVAILMSILTLFGVIFGYWLNYLK